MSLAPLHSPTITRVINAVRSYVYEHNEGLWFSLSDATRGHSDAAAAVSRVQVVSQVLRDKHNFETYHLYEELWICDRAGFNAWKDELSRRRDMKMTEWRDSLIGMVKVIFLVAALCTQYTVIVDPFFRLIRSE